MCIYHFAIVLALLIGNITKPKVGKNHSSSNTFVSQIGELIQPMVEVYIKYPQIDPSHKDIIRYCALHMMPCPITCRVLIGMTLEYSVSKASPRSMSKKCNPPWRKQPW